MPSLNSIVRAFASLGHDLGSGNEAVAEILGESDEGFMVEQPLTVCGSMFVLRDGSLIKQVWVQCTRRSHEDVTWEYLSDFQAAYQAYDLEDKNANPFDPRIPQNEPHDQIVQELDELLEIFAMIDSRLENIDHNQIVIPPPASLEQLLNDFMNPPDFIKMDNLESDIEFM
uniref:Uncharacterized protein n=1 Tax=Tanacetum cinerariifolium TaxID=118510 RepID=A0A6L2JAX2_TANCI|nr:hypothetical protein [Tanacetum cinerariifolium]